MLLKLMVRKFAEAAISYLKYNIHETFFTGET